MVPSDLYSRARSHPLAQRFSQSAYAAKVTKYAIGSVIALLTSIIVFAISYVILGGHPTTCSILAFFAGAIPNWILNRRWAWKMTGRADFLREIVAYIAISGVVLVASSLSTTWMQDWVKLAMLRIAGWLGVAVSAGADIGVGSESTGDARSWK